MAYFKCKDCGCEDIQVQMWVNPNTNEIIDFVGGGMDRECWCPNCDTTTRWITTDEFNKMCKP